MLIDPKGGEGRKKSFSYKTKKRRNKNMIHNIESLAALPPLVHQIVRVPRGNNNNFQQSKESTVVYLCVHLLVPFGL